MRHPGFMAAFADRVGDIDDLSGFIVIFLVVTVVTCFWNDVSKHSHPHENPAAYKNRIEKSDNEAGVKHDDRMERI